MPSSQILKLRYFRWSPTICHTLLRGALVEKPQAPHRRSLGPAIEHGPDGGEGTAPGLNLRSVCTFLGDEINLRRREQSVQQYRFRAGRLEES
jgi:hypothetical protein